MKTVVTASRLAIVVPPQPDPTTCGPTCLHALYRYYDDELALADVVAEVPALPGGGTLGVHLATHALGRGYRATIYTYNLQLFDPTWFPADPDRLAGRLRAQRDEKADPKLALATDAYLTFLARGGQVASEDLTPDLVRRFLGHGVPVLTGLSATYLYGCARERADDYDDVGGLPTGHFVVLSGYDEATDQVRVADPLHDNPGFGASDYRVAVARVIGAILLGIVTYDANLLVITPPDHAAPR